MKHYTLNWLKFSIIFVLFVSSCKKKEKDIFDDFPPGKFDFVWTSNQNGIEDTIIGEVSGPYPIGGKYFFRKKIDLGAEEFSFMLSARTNGIEIDEIEIYHTNIGGKIINYTVSKEKLNIAYKNTDTLTGFFYLSRK